MAIVQATRPPGSIVVEAASPGLAGATATIHAREGGLRPQVPPWERPVPSGPGVTGLWRPVVVAEAAAPTIRCRSAAAAAWCSASDRTRDAVTGELDAAADGFFDPSPGGVIEDGRIDGTGISFRVGRTKYEGTVSGDRIEVVKDTPFPFPPPARPPATTAPQPVVGPPPDGSDPSFGPWFGALGAPARLVLHRVQR